MNRRRQDNHTRISPVVIFALILAGAIGAVGGITYVYFRNCQIETAREIDVIERRIEQHQLDIRTVQMRSDQILNLFAIRKTLEDLGTDMRPIPAGVSEDMLPNLPNAVASADTSL
ncbi:hypothetical protein ACFSSA_09140 [Luteolibacter algae]|uniref:Cell division protein FtsL n=1 Tax=Luteolibacter algae TaxID=454151 RepID=A0ABW5D8V2_9BACT